MGRLKGSDAAVVCGNRLVPSHNRSAFIQIGADVERVRHVGNRRQQGICIHLAFVRNLVLITIQGESAGDITTVRNTVHVAIEQLARRDLTFVRNTISITILLGAIGNLTGVRNQVHVAVCFNPLSHITDVILKVLIAVVVYRDPDTLTAAVS